MTGEHIQMAQAPEPPAVHIYFSDFFEVSPTVLEEYGAFDVSLVNDLPLFVDPFLLFNSKDPTYQRLHRDIIRYLRFLRDSSRPGRIDPGLLAAWYRFKEVKQNWLGFSANGNRGSGLGHEFADALHKNLGTIFTDFGQEQITRDSHLEKVCLVAPGVGRDNISDLSTCLIKEYLLEYTQKFALDHLQADQRASFRVERTRFNYDTETWEAVAYELPHHAGDYVLLTPNDILTRDDTWISRPDLFRNFAQIVEAVPNIELRAQLNRYLYSQLSRDENMSEKERAEDKRKAVDKTIVAYPEVIEHYIRQKEDDGDRATIVSSEKVADTAEWFVKQLREFVATRFAGSEFYETDGDTFGEARQRALYLKHIIEDRDGYRLFYHDGKPVQREQDLQLLYTLTWRATPSDVNREVNNGRGPVDFTISRGSRDKSLVEFKLASNSQLKRNLRKQVPVYEAANDTRRSLKVVCYFSERELAKTEGILRELGLENDASIILIDARADNKPSGSKA